MKKTGFTVVLVVLGLMWINGFKTKCTGSSYAGVSLSTDAPNSLCNKTKLYVKNEGDSTIKVYASVKKDLGVEGAYFGEEKEQTVVEVGPSDETEIKLYTNDNNVLYHFEADNSKEIAYRYEFR